MVAHIIPKDPKARQAGISDRTSFVGTAAGIIAVIVIIAIIVLSALLL